MPCYILTHHIGKIVLWYTCPVVYIHTLLAKKVCSDIIVLPVTYGCQYTPIVHETRTYLMPIRSSTDRYYSIILLANIYEHTLQYYFGWLVGYYVVWFFVLFTFILTEERNLLLPNMYVRHRTWRLQSVSPPQYHVMSVWQLYKISPFMICVVVVILHLYHGWGTKWTLSLSLILSLSLSFFSLSLVCHSLFSYTIYISVNINISFI